MIGNLRSRLFLAFSGLAVIVVALAGFSLFELIEQKQRLEHEIRQSLAIMVSAGELQGTVGDVQRLAFQAGMEKNEELLYSAGAKAGEFFDLHRRLLIEVRQLPGTEAPLREALLGNLDKMASSFRRIVANSLALIAEQIERGEAQEAWFVHTRLASQVVSEELDRFAQAAKQGLNDKMTASIERLDQGIALHRATIACAVVALFLFMLFLSRQVTHPMRLVSGFVGRAGESPLDIAERYRPLGLAEIDTVGQGVNQLLEHLQFAARVKLSERYEMLKAVAAASSMLLSRHDEKETVGRVLRLIGGGMKASRAYLFECHAAPVTGQELISQRYEWCADGIDAQKDNPAVHDIAWETSLARWPAIMHRGDVVAGPVAESPPEEADYFGAQGILSLICVPIFLNGTLWGFVGLDDCIQPRRWNDFEIEALKSIGADIGNLILWQRATDQLRLSTQVFLHSGEAITVTDAAGTIVSVNPAFTAITGYEAADALGKTPAILKSGRHDAEFYRRLWHDLHTTGQWHGEIWNRRKSGEVYPEWLSISAVRTESGEVTNYVAIFSDITERKATEKRIEFLAHHDPLTGLPNRTLFIERIESSLAMARRSGHRLAIMFLDLDHFKTVNDSLGHAVGDSLLRHVAERLKRNVRETDTVCRQGGDEFIVLLSDIGDGADAAQVALKLIASLQEPMSIGDARLHISVSVGIAVFPDDGDSTTTLLKNADMAMYSSKESGRNTYRFFTADMHDRALARLSMESRLRHAIEAGEFELHFQPQWSQANRHLTGAEALIRWRSDTGMVAPGNFIPVAEESGLIVPIGSWVVREACRQAVLWGNADIGVAVNVSPVQVRRSDLVTTIREGLAESGLAPYRLELEITESLLVGDDPGIREIIERLKALGVKLAIDDFGTGYSSLAYLKRFAVDRLKIDQSFVRNITRDSDDAAIVRAIVQMAKSLRLNTIAEGVETSEQLALLGEFGCDDIQGYLLGRPIPAGDFAQLATGEHSGHRQIT